MQGTGTPAITFTMQTSGDRVCFSSTLYTFLFPSPPRRAVTAADPTERGQSIQHPVTSTCSGPPTAPVDLGSAGTAPPCVVPFDPGRGP